MHEESYDHDQSEDDQYFEAYNALSVHELMLKDAPRMDFYKSVLVESELKNKVVVDVGAGSGVLSCWAAKYGANHVFAIEASSLSEILPSVFLTNNVQDKVSIIPFSVDKLVTNGVNTFIHDFPFIKNHPDGISLVVSEWMGFYLFHEGMLEAVLKARDFFREVNKALGVTSDLQLIPSQGQLYAAPISLDPMREKYRKEWENIYGLNFSSLGLLALEEKIELSSPLIDTIPDSCLLHDGHEAWKFNFSTISSSQLENLSSSCVFHFSSSSRFKEYLLRNRSKHVAMDGIVIWFSVSYKRHVLDTSPFSPPTHWKQTAILLPKEYRDNKIVSFSTSEDESLSINLNMKKSNSFKRCYQITYELN